MHKLLGLNKTKYNGKEYSNQDIKGMVPVNQLGYGTDFYGGRVKMFGKTDDPDIFLCLNEVNDVLDILIVEPEEKKSADEFLKQAKENAEKEIADLIASLKAKATELGVEFEEDAKIDELNKLIEEAEKEKDGNTPPKPLEEMSAKELKIIADGLGIEYKSNTPATKLVEMIKEKQALKED